MKKTPVWLLLFTVGLGACHRSAPALSGALTLGWQMQGEAVNDDFGFKCTWAGDVNGDGYDDVLVAAPGHDGHRGKLYLYYGSAQGLASKPAWTAEGEFPGDSFSTSMGAAGDLNGDGYSDFYVAAPNFSRGLRGRGKLYVFYGGPQGPHARADWSKEGATQDEIYGDCSSGLGDINGDGYGDLIVGAYGFDHGKGKVELYLGGPQGLGRKPAWTMIGEKDGDNLGYSHGSAGDVNGDGFGDVLVGAKYSGEAFRFAGKAWCFQGSRDGIHGSAPWVQHGDSENSLFANRLYSAGDVNGDGYGDVIVGAPGAEKNAGRAYLYVGSPQGLSLQPQWIHTGPLSSRSGHSVNCAGDVNGDGFDDVLIGMPGNPSSPGRVELFLGSPQGLGQHANWSLEGLSPSANLGLWTASAGDVNGDGASDILVGAPGFAENRGQVSLYFGKSQAQGLARPRQWTSNLRRAIGPTGASSPNATVALSLDVKPEAFSNAKQVCLEAEFKFVGQAFDGTKTQRSAWIPVTSATQTLVLVSTGLSAQHSYRWRVRALGQAAVAGKSEEASVWLRPSFGSLSGGAYFRTWSGPQSP